MKQYTIKLNEKQLGLICKSASIHAFLICGQLENISAYFMEAWTRNHNKEIGSREWSEMWKETGRMLTDIRKKYWGEEHHGHYYDDTADILFDISNFCESAITKDTDCPSSVSREQPIIVTEGADLTWQDVRRIVKIAVAELGRRTQDELAEMGEDDT